MSKGVERIKIKNSKGQNIAVVIHRPDVETEKLAILCPGFLDTKDYDHVILLSEELSKKVLPLLVLIQLEHGNQKVIFRNI